MNNSIKKIISLLASVTVVSMSIPAVFAENEAEETNTVDIEEVVVTDTVAAADETEASDEADTPAATESVEEPDEDPDAEHIIDENDFSDLSAIGSGFSLGPNSGTPVAIDEYISLLLGTRNDANSSVGWFSNTIDTAHGTSLRAALGSYVSAGRGPKMTFNVPSKLTEGKRIGIRMEYYPVNSGANTADLTIYDPGTEAAAATLVVGDTLKASAWNNIEIINDQGSYMVIVNGDTLAASGTMTSGVYPQLRFTEVNGASSATIDNIVLYTDGKMSDEMYLNLSMGAFKFAAQSVLGVEGTNLTASDDFTVPSDPDGITVDWEVQQRPVGSEKEEDWTSSKFVTISNGLAKIAPTSEIDDYEVRLNVTATYGSAVWAESYNVALPNPMDELTAALESGYEVVNTTEKQTVAVAATEAPEATADPEATAEPDATEAPTAAPVETIVPVTFDLKGSEVLKYDLELPVKANGCKNIGIAWTSSDNDSVKITKDNIASIMTSDLDVHDVTLTAVLTYNKNGVIIESDPQVFDIKMGMTAEDVASTDALLDKYKVRYDVAYEDNFKDVPSSTTSDIKLPTEGMFGSKISWTSDAPTVISNSGTVNRPSSTRNVTLAASIMSGAVSEGKNFKISVSGSKSSSGGGGGGGGGSISSVGTINNPSAGTLPNDLAPSTVDPTVSGSDRTEQLAEEALQATDLFKDLSQASWARAEINALAAAGIINGKSETLFAPNDNVTRAEFAKMLMGAFNLASSGSFASSSFSDVSTSAWYFDSVETAYNLGIINGVSDTEFSPNANITRQDMAVMVMRAAKATSKVPEAVVDAANFADNGSIADYAKEAVDTLQRAGIINGMTDTTFAPNGNATRAQAAKILYAFLNK